MINIKDETIRVKEKDIENLANELNRLSKASTNIQNSHTFYLTQAESLKKQVDQVYFLITLKIIFINKFQAS